MKKLRKIKKERGAITVMSALMMIVVLGFTALSIDIGLHNYLGAKLQNAVDSAATAVAANIDADEASLYDYAYEYLAKNGYDRTSDKYKDDKIKVKIEHKVSRTDAAAYAEAANARAGSNEYSEYDFYITSGVYKITADVDDSTLFGNALGINSLHLSKTAYVKAEANYEAFPEALKYSIFAGATKDSTIQDNDGNTITVGNEDYPGIDIQGNAGAGSNAGSGGANAFSTVVGIAERGINGAWDFIQNIMSWFGYTPNNNPLVTINVSEATFNNNAHSNSNIMIGVQALNASRVKDTDYSGNTTTYNQAANENTSTDTYSDADDYGQVRFTAYDDIKFGYSTYIKNKEFKNTLTDQVSKLFFDYIKNRPELTRTYVQNQQCLQVTQHVINILDTMNLDGNISDNFSAAADNYFTANKAISQKMQDMVKAQGSNITKKTENGETYIEIANQESIVYRVNQARAQNYLNIYVNNENVTGSSRAALKKSRFDLLTQELGNNWDNAIGTNGRPVYENNGDSESTLTYPTVVLNKTYTDNEGQEHTYSYNVKITGRKVDRNTDTIFGPSIEGDSSRTNNATYIGAKYATVRTFREQAEYINIPNLKPYFTRQINKSVNNATKTVTNINSGNWQGSAYGVADAVEKAVAEINDTSSKIKYEDNTFADDSNNKTKYWGEGNEGSKKNYAYDTLFTRYYGTKSNESSDNNKLYDLTSSNQTFKNFYNDKEYTLKHSTSTTFRGVKIFNDDKSLRTPDQILTEQFNAKFGGENPEFGAQKIRKYYESLSALKKPNTAVGAKETEINNQYSSSTYNEQSNNNLSYTSQQKKAFAAIRDAKRTTIDYDAVTPPAPGTTQYTQEVSTPTVPLPADVFLGGSGANHSVNVADNNGKRLVFNTNIRTANQGYTPDATQSRMTSENFYLPARASNSYADTTINDPSDYGYNTTLVNLTVPDSAPSGYTNKGKISSGIKDTYCCGDKTWYTSIESPYSGSAIKTRRNVFIDDGYEVYVRDLFDLSGDQKNNLWLADTTNANNPTVLYINGNLTLGNRNSIYIGKNSTIVVDGDLITTGHNDIKNSDFPVLTTIRLAEGAKLIVHGKTEMSTYTWLTDKRPAYLRLDSGSEFHCDGHVDVDNIVLSGTAKLYSKDYVKPYKSLSSEANSIIMTKNFLGGDGYDITNNGKIYASTYFTWCNNKTFTNNGTIYCKGEGTAEETKGASFPAAFVNNTGKTATFKTTFSANTLTNNAGTVIVGTSITTAGDIKNNPGDTSAKNATIKVNGSVTVNNGCWIYNSSDNYASGARADFYVGGATSCGKFQNFASSHFYSNGTLTAGSIINKSGCELMSSGIKSTGAVTNNGTMYATSSFDADGATENYGYIYSGGTLEMSGLTNSQNCEVISLGNMTLSGTISTASAKLESGGAILGSGSITCRNLDVLNSITASSITVSNRIKTNGNITLTGALDIASDANVISYGSISAGSIINRGIVNVFGYEGAGGNITTTSGSIINLKDIRCYGDLDAKTDLSNGYYWVSNEEIYRNDDAAIRCRGDVKVGNHLDNYGTMFIGTITEGTGTPNDGNLTVNGRNSGDDSISNFGNIYACDNITCEYQIYSWGKNIYTLGDIVACKSGGTNILNLVATNNVYVRGVVTSSSAGKHIYIHNPDNVSYANSVLSILGVGASAGEDCFNNKLEQFCNMQEGSKVYLGTGINITNANADSTTLYNAGRMYIFGEVNINTENGKANAVSLWGTYNYGDTDYSEHNYSGITYCLNKFNAPNTTVNVAGNHLLYIDGGLDDGANNFTITQLNMSNQSQFYTHDGVDVDGTIELTGSAIFNVLDGVESSGIHPGSGTRVIAPNEVKLNGTVLSDLPDTVFGSEDNPLTGSNAIRTPSLIGSGIRIKIFGDLIVNGNIELTGSALIVTGTVKCDNLTLNGANFVCGGNLTVKNDSNVPGYINAYNSSIARIDSQIVTASNISADNASIYSAKGVGSASTMTLSSAAQFITRDSGDVQEAGASALTENDDHNDNLNLSGAVNVSGGSKLYVNGNINTSSVTANGGSEVYGYSGIVFSGNNTIEIDNNTHLTNNSIIFCGPNTVDTVNYEINANGTLYLPPNKDFGKSGSKQFKLNIKKFGNVIIDSPVYTTELKIGDQNDGEGRTALLYTAGRLTVTNCTYSNYGRLYSMGGTNITGCKNSSPGHNTADYWFQDGSENFFGKLYDNSGNRITTLSYAGLFEGRGDIYIDANLTIGNDCDWDECKVGNRYTALYIKTGNTYITGNVNLPTGSGIYTAQNAGVYVGGNLNMTSAIYNYGTINVYKKLNVNYDSNEKRYLTDCKDDNDNKKVGYRKGISIKNGVDQTEDESKDNERVNTGAKFIVYNEGKALSQDNYIVHLLGYIKNTGDMYFNANMNIEGYNNYVRVYDDSAFWNLVGANAHFAGYVYLNGNQLFNRRNGTFSCGGDLLFGGCIYNCGKLAAGGDISNHEYAKDAQGNYTNQSLSCNGQKYWEVPMSGFNFSLVNGMINNGGQDILAWKIWWAFDRDHMFQDATIYCGGKLQLGKGEYGDDATAGSMFNFGNIYVRDDVDVFTNGSKATHRVAIWDYNDTSMIVGGHVFGGGGIATGNGSLFMCGDEFRAKRSVKINANFRMQNWIADYITFNDKTSDNGHDILSPAYFYVGGNFYGNIVGKSILDNGQPDVLSRIASVFGTDISHAVAWPENSSRDLDIYANTNMFVGGSFYSNAKIYAKENVSIVVASKDTLYKSNGSLRDELYTSDLIATFKQWLDSNIKLGNGNNTPYSFVTYQLLDAWEASRIIVNGGMFVQDTCKVRDMAQVYANGNFKCNKYVEIGKALDGQDETEAKETGRRSLKDEAWKTEWLNKHPGATGSQAEDAFMNRYKFDNAGYMYVGGDFDSARYTKIYASTALKVKGDFRTTTYLTLRHDGQIYVGKKLRAGTSIDGGAYCQMYVNGSMQAVTDNIKIRDQATVFVGGNMTTPSYIELGKYDPNFDRGIQQIIPITEGISSQYDNAVSQDNDAANPDQEVNNGGTDASDSNNTTDNPTGGEGTGSDNLNENESSTQFSDVGEADAEKQIYAVNEESEYVNDTSDVAKGGKFYIAGDVVSSTSYIREYAFSRVISGGYVYSPRHITLRHNADFWVLPEVFGKITYDYTPYVPQEDTSRNWIEEIGYKIGEMYRQTAHALYHTFSAKAGSVYSIGQLTLNTNASIFATYDVMCFGQTALKGDSLIYVGHDFDCWAPMYTFQMDTSSASAFWTSLKANLGIVDGNTTRTYKGFDTYDQYDKTRTYTIEGQSTGSGTYTRTARNPHPIIVYANNEINIATTTTMRGTYLIANRGNLNFTDLDVISSSTDVTPSDATSLPNALASYQHNINFFAMRGTLGALFYSPRGNTNLDGWYYDFYGSIVGKTVNFDSYYINVHRFNNWRTLDLQLATSSNVYLVSEDDYLYAEEDKNFNNLYGYEPTPDTSINQWAQPFFRGIDTSEVSEDEQNAGSTDVTTGSDQLGNGGTPHNDQTEGNDD